jgi:hypothetical protein
MAVRPENRGQPLREMNRILEGLRAADKTDAHNSPRMRHLAAEFAEPPNLFPRYVLGVQEAAPGWIEAVVRPIPGPLAFAEGLVPTPRGPIRVAWENRATFRLRLELPHGVPARIELPASGTSRDVFVDGRKVAAARSGAWWILAEPLSDSHLVEVR